MILGMKVTKPKGSMSTKEELHGYLNTESTNALEEALRIGIKRMEYRLDLEETSTEPEEEEDNQERAKPRKRRKVEKYGDGWENSSPPKWRSGKLGLPTSFSEVWRRDEFKEKAKKATEELRSDKMEEAAKAATPVKLKIKRLESKIGKEKKKNKFTQINIKQFIKLNQVVENSSNPETNLQTQGRAALGAWRMAGTAAPTSEPSITPGKEGMEHVGQRRGAIGP